MFVKTTCKAAFAATAALALTACGGTGGGGGVQSLPPPPPAPPPPPPPPPPPSAEPIDILASAPTGELASLTSSGSTGNLSIRYDAALNTYEVRVDNADWQGLRPSATYGSNPQHYFSFGPTGTDESFFQVYATSKDAAPNDYQYSSLAVWGKGVGAYWDQSNYTAFGVATADASMPVTGSASYHGLIAGNSDVMEADNLVGGSVAATISGSVDLNFDFAAGSVAGSMHPTLSAFAGDFDLGVLSFVDTVYSTGSTTFSGRFDTALGGANAFEGRFTGPAAEELIGRWTFPFIYSGDGAAHSASGAWIARRP